MVPYGGVRSVAITCAPPWLAAHVLPPAIQQFREHWPDVRVRLFDGDRIEVARRVIAGKVDLGLGIFERTPGVRRAPFFRFSLMVVRPDRNAGFNRVSTRWTALAGQTLISLTPDYPHQQQIEKAGVSYTCGQTVNLLDTQIGLVEAGEGIAIIPSFGLPGCRSRKVAMLEFYEISHRGRKLPEEAAEFSGFLKRYIARWAGDAGIL